jgi:hypothetical protein
MAKQLTTSEDPEIIAISAVYVALKDLDNDARNRVLNYVSSKFGLQGSGTFQHEREDSPNPNSNILPQSNAETLPVYELTPHYSDELDGISPAGRKWITRSGISPSKLMTIFSLGIDEIDLISKSVPGSKKSQRMRSAFLLKGLAAYLGTGTARFSHEQIKETCLHYDAWDTGNFAVIYKSMAADVSGGKDTGYTLTAKGISEATNLVKSMIGFE